LTLEERTLWYENAFRPAISALLGDAIASEWPATYETERLRACKARGGYSWGTKLIPKDVVSDLADCIRDQLNTNRTLTREDMTWASDFFFLHTIRGVKHASFHRVDSESSEYYLNDFILDARLSGRVPFVGDWYIDVGIEISSEENACLQWMTNAHPRIVQQALHISDDSAQRITDITSSQYSRDLSSHLTAVSGFRIVPGVRAQGEFEARYLQAYTTDKSVVYNPEGGHHAKFLTTKEAMGHTQPAKTVEGIYTIYEQAMIANSSNARLEVRVPYRFATQVLIEFDVDQLRDSLCAFTREEWW